MSFEARRIQNIGNLASKSRHEKIVVIVELVIYVHKMPHFFSKCFFAIVVLLLQGQKKMFLIRGLACSMFCVKRKCVGEAQTG